MRNLSVLLSVIILIVWACTGCRPLKIPDVVPPSDNQLEPASNAVSATAFSIPGLNEASGKTIDSKSYLGQVVLLDFWAPWCEPCRSEIPALNTLYESKKDNGFTIVGMTIDSNAADNIPEEIAQLNLAYPVGLAGPDIIAAYRPIRAVPTKILIDKQGRIRQRYAGVVSDTKLAADINILAKE